MDYHSSRNSHRRFEEELEAEARAEKRIINAKKVCDLTARLGFHCLVC